MASSDSVTSRGVPNTVVVLNSESTASRTRSRSGTRIARVSGWAAGGGVGEAGGGRARWGGGPATEGDGAGGRGGLEVAPQPVEQVAPPFGQVDDARGHAV